MALAMPEGTLPGARRVDWELTAGRPRRWAVHTMAMSNPPGWAPYLDLAAWSVVSRADKGARLELAIHWGGGGTYDHADVVEDDASVAIRVFVRRIGPIDPHARATTPRTMELRAARIVVHLASPLGQRRLVGGDTLTPQAEGQVPLGPVDEVWSPG